MISENQQFEWKMPSQNLWQKKRDKENGENWGEGEKGEREKEGEFEMNELQ